MRSDEPAVRVRSLTKRYGKLVAVERLSFELPSGVIAGLIGPNGAGKTTTLAMLLGLVGPTAGDATVLGHPIGDPAAYLGRVGALIETPPSTAP
jgi:ABC-2 type transport system ATP-binding protein